MARKNLITTLYAGAFTKRGVKLYGGIALAAIVIFAVIYFNTQMRPVDLLSRFEADTQPVQAKIVRYDFDQNKTELDLEDQEAVSALWQAMETSKVRYVSYLSAASVPVGGYYYEVSLYDADAAGGETATYAYGCNTAQELIIQSRSYRLTNDNTVLDALDALFTQYEDQVTPAS